MQQTSLFGDDEHPDQTQASADEVLHWMELMTSKKEWEKKAWREVCSVLGKYIHIIRATPAGEARIREICDKLQKRLESEDEGFDKS